MKLKRKHKNKSNFSWWLLLFIVLTLIVTVLSLKRPQNIIEKAAVLQCPGAEQCPVAGYPDHLRNCTPPQADNSPDEQLCNQVGRIGSCGGKTWCCPSAGGAWTQDLTKCPNSATPTPVPTANNCRNPNVYNPWDVDQNGSVNVVDIGLIIDHYDKDVCTYPKADVNNDGSITILDIGSVIDNYDF